MGLIHSSVHFCFSRKTPTSGSKASVLDGIVSVESQASTIRADHDECMYHLVFGIKTSVLKRIVLDFLFLDSSPLASFPGVKAF